jgi:MFS family permease
MSMVFVAFLVIGMAMPVLPLHVHEELGQGPFMVGLVAASQFAAALLTRVWAGRLADTRGAKGAVMVGLLAAGASGALYLLSLVFAPSTSVYTLLVGRAVLGAGESFVITGAQAWGLALSGGRNTGKVMAWVGTAMYGAFALGAPLGGAVYGPFGFGGIALATLVLPLGTVALVVRMANVAPVGRISPPLKTVLGAIWLPGVGMALASFGFGAMTAFGSLLFAARGWLVWPAFTSFAAAFILARLSLGSLADRLGGARVAFVFVLMEAAGLALLWAAPSYFLGLAGAVLSGFGYSLVYPGFGVEAVQRAPVQSRGLAMGAYTAFLDLTLGVATPLLGAVAAWAGIGTVFLVSAVAVGFAAAVAFRLLPQRIATGSDLRPFA